MAEAAKKQKPVRAIPQADLRKAWSEGHTYYIKPREDMYTRREKMDATPIEVQSLDDLCGGDAVKVMNDLLDGKAIDYGEPLRESTRSWIQTGVGVLSANMVSMFNHGDGDEGRVELIDVGMSDPERNAQMYRWVQLTGVDPIMQRAIVWEKIASQNGDPIAIQIFKNADGVLSIRVVSRWWQKTMTEKQWQRVALKLLKEHAAEIERVFNKFSSAYAAEEKWRWEAPADPMWHTSYESYGPVEEGDRLPDGTIATRDGLPGEPWTLKRIVARSPAPAEGWYKSNTPLWHATGRDQVERELGMHCMADDLLEELLGITEWDEDGNPCVSED